MVVAALAAGALFGIGVPDAVAAAIASPVTARSHPATIVAGPGTAVSPVTAGLHATTIVAGPGTAVSYPAGSVSARFSGLAFDACTAPSTATMRAWTASPYRAAGIYVGGPNRLCAQPNLTQTWITAVTALGWKLLPIYLGRQAPCVNSGRALKITAGKATAQGRADADAAITALTGLGLRPGSPVYSDLENYGIASSSCRTAVLRYLSAVTGELHHRGYLSGVYVNLSSGAAQLTAAYTGSTYARPDALWVARWDDKPTVSGLSGVPASRWSGDQRIKQYLGNHVETYAGVKMNIDRDAVQAPVAVVSASYPLLADGSTAYTAPGIGATAVHTLAAGQPVPVLCQAPGRTVAGSDVWDRLADGTYLSDADVATPAKPGYTNSLPRCYYPFQVTASDGLTRRTGSSAGTAGHGALPLGALAWIACQKSGQKVDRTRIWDQLDDGRYVTDRYVATPSSTTYSTPIPRC